MRVITYTLPSIKFLYGNGSLTESEAGAKLEALNIRGAFDCGAFLGYDYSNQEWVEFSR